MKNIWLIGGMGPSLNREGLDKIQALINRQGIITIGVNRFPHYFDNVGYTLFLDRPRNNMVEKTIARNPGIKLVVNDSDLACKKNQWVHKPHHIIHTCKKQNINELKYRSGFGGIEVIETDGGGNSALAAMHYAYLMGDKPTILLIGVEFKTDWLYFDGSDPDNKPTRTKSYIQSCRDTLLKFSENMELITLDSESDLAIPKASICGYL
jgi:hypothetical protein